MINNISLNTLIFNISLSTTNCDIKYITEDAYITHATQSCVLKQGFLAVLQGTQNDVENGLVYLCVTDT